MTWESISASYGKMIKSEVYRRCRNGNNANLDWEDYYQTAALTAWELCRDKDKEEIDGKILRNRIRDALYSLSTRSHGIHLTEKVYKKWANREAPGHIVCVTSLDGLLDPATESPSSGRVCPESLRGDETALSVAAFISSLPRDERAVLACCVHWGYRSPQNIARIINKPCAEAAKSLASLRKRCIDYFDCRVAA